MRLRCSEAELSGKFENSHLNFNKLFLYTDAIKSTILSFFKKKIIINNCS